MIIGSRFEGDTHHHVMEIQHDVYGEMVTHLADAAKRKYRFSEDVLGSDTVPGMIVSGESHFDHRILQYAHDLIAAHFRYAYADRLHPELPLPGQEDNTQRVRHLWREFMHKEIATLTEIPLFTRAVVEALAFANTDAGYKAEDRLYEFLHNRYTEIPQPAASTIDIDNKG